MHERFEIIRSPHDEHRFALRFVFGNGDKRSLGDDFRRRGDARNVVESIEAACMYAGTGEANSGSIEIRDLSLFDDDGHGDSPWWLDRRGDVVHLSTCGYATAARGARPWGYARPLSLDQVINEVSSLPWLRCCQRCFPAAIKAIITAADAWGDACPA